jgi:aminoglycoside 6'-N-acetyltransferase
MTALTLRSERIELRAIEPADLDDLHRIVSTPEVAGWWNPHTREELADWLAEEHVIRWTIWIDGAVAGKIQASEENEPDFRHAGIDVFLDPAFHGRGLGRECVRIVAHWLLGERGHHRIVIDPAAANERAIRCYEAVGFRRVGVMRSYWFDRTIGDWVDGLLLDLLRSELRG